METRVVQKGQQGFREPLLSQSGVPPQPLEVTLPPVRAFDPPPQIDLS